jgi:hypothetical protein
MTIGITAIDKSFADQLVFSLKCPSCDKQILLKCDTLDKPVVCCTECERVLYFQLEQKQARMQLISCFDFYRTRLQTSGLGVHILGDFQPTDLFYETNT